MSKKGNKKIILQSEKLSNVKYHGKPMMQYSYVASKGVTNDEIKAFLKSQEHFKNKRKLAKDKHGKRVPEYALPSHEHQSANTSEPATAS